MNKELFCTSTPTTKVTGLRRPTHGNLPEWEGEYTLAGSIYKGRVARVRPACSRHLSTLA
jgi:hypothetical protein